MDTVLTSNDAITSQTVNATGSMIEIMRSATVQNYSCLSAFVLVLMDYLYTFPDELKYIWGQSLSTTKVSFLFLRYYSLLSQIATCLVAMFRLYHIPAARNLCKGWFALQMFSYWAIFSVSDMTLMWRVYDLYDRSQVITVILISLFTLETIVTAVVTTLALSALQFDPVCNGTDIPPAVVVFACTVIFCRCIVWALNFRKSDFWLSQDAFLNALTSNGNGTWFWIAVSAMLAVTIPSCYGHQIALPHIVFSWPMTLQSIGTGRLLLSQEKHRYELFQEFMKEQQAEPSRARGPVPPSVAEIEPPCATLEVATLNNTESTCHKVELVDASFPHEPSEKIEDASPRSLPPQSDDMVGYSSSSTTTFSDGESEGDKSGFIEVGSMHFRSSFSSDGRELW